MIANNIEMNAEMEITNVMNDIGIKMVGNPGNPGSKYYTIMNPKTSRTSNYDIRFPFDWAINDIETENGCGPTACFACDQRCINDVFVHYCNKCLHKFVGKRGNPLTSDQIDEDEELWEKAPYMQGVRVADIGQEEEEEEEEEDYSPFQSAEHMERYDKATQIQEDQYQDQFIIEEPQSVIEYIPYPTIFVDERP
jgi:hypothetical protein